MPGTGSRGRSAWIRKIGWIVFAAWLFIGLLPISNRAAAAAEGTGADAVRTFRQSADKLYAAVSQGNRLEASRSLRELELALRGLPLSKIATAEGVQALAGSVAEIKRAWASVTPDAARLEAAAGEIRLAADELENPDKPMWHRYRPILKEDANALAAAIGDGTGLAPADARSALDRLKKHYRLIRTAASLRSEPSAVERGDSVLRYAEKILKPDKPDASLARDLVPSVREAMEGLFPAEDRETAAAPTFMPPSWGFAATIGSFIVTILSWAGWRRFRYDRDHPPSRPPSDPPSDPSSNAKDHPPVNPPGSLPPERRERR